MPFWTELGKRVRDAGAKYIVQLAFSGPPARHPERPLRQGPLLHRQARPGPRLPVRADDEGADRRGRRLVRAGRAPRARGRARRDRDPRLQRLPDHAVPLLGDQRPHRRVRRLAREPRALPARGRARDAQGDRRRLPPPVQDQRDRRRQGALPLGQGGDDARGVDPGLQVAGGGRRRRAARLVRLPLPPPAQPGGQVPHRRRDPLLRHDALEREEHVPELPHVPHAADQQGLRLGVGAADARSSASRGSTSSSPARSSRRSTSRCSAPAASRPPP